MLDADLAQVYGVTAKRLNEQVRRNTERFPSDFAFRLDIAEAAALRLQIAGPKRGHGGRRYLPYVFTEHGAVMLSSVLNSPLAIRASILVARAFVQLREALSTHKDLLRKLDELEKRVGTHDTQLLRLLEAIRDLTTPPERPPTTIGFLP